MPAKDLYHDAVKKGLEKEGWTITDDPYFLEIGDTSFHVNLGAEKLIAATKGTESIAVEVKSFVGASPTSEFHTALGQFLNYSLAIQFREPDRKLFLAVPDIIYDEFFQSVFMQMAVKHYQVSIIVFDPESNEILQWKK